MQFKYDKLLDIIKYIVTILSIIVLLVVIIYFIVTFTFKRFGNNPYPFEYGEPYEYESNTEYNSNNAIDFIKYLDSLADAIDAKYKGKRE